MSQVREASRGLLRFSMARRARPLDAGELGRSAMVFAPHPDDETLGCGGTILQKRRAGAEVRIVFVTDGAASNPHVSTPEEMRRIRHQEALDASAILGVESARVHWLAFPDGALATRHAQAVTRVRELLRAHRPAQLFVPYPRNEHPDHVATHAIVHEALAQERLAAVAFEYPVWSWRHWPQRKERSGGWARGRAAARALVWGARFLREMRACVPVQPVLEQKRAALAAHVSQVERPEGVAHWSTLSDVDGGAFLESLFQEYEYFRRVEPGDSGG